MFFMEGEGRKKLLDGCGVGKGTYTGTIDTVHITGGESMCGRGAGPKGEGASFKRIWYGGRKTKSGQGRDECEGGERLKFCSTFVVNYRCGLMVEKGAMFAKGQKNPIPCK